MKRLSYILALVLVTISFGCSTTQTRQPDLQADLQTAPCTNKSKPPESKPASSPTIPDEKKPVENTPIKFGNDIAIVTVNVANLRSDPSLTSDVVIQPEKNDLLALVGEYQTGPWYEVVHVRSGKTGWIHNDVIRLFRDQSLIASESPNTYQRSEPEVTPAPTYRQTPQPQTYSSTQSTSSGTYPSTQSYYDPPPARPVATYTPPPAIYTPPSTYRPPVAQNGSYYGEISPNTGRPKTVYVRPYVRSDGTPVRSYYRSAPRRH